MIQSGYISYLIFSLRHTLPFFTWTLRSSSLPSPSMTGKNDTELTIGVTTMSAPLAAPVQQEFARQHVEHHSEHAVVMRDVVIGLSDGLTVPFALAAGLTALNNTQARIRSLDPVSCRFFFSWGCV
jgi:hypothetical protein